jgi:hypothetical protein
MKKIMIFSLFILIIYSCREKNEYAVYPDEVKKYGYEKQYDNAKWMFYSSNFLEEKYVPIGGLSMKKVATLNMLDFEVDESEQSDFLYCRIQVTNATFL